MANKVQSERAYESLKERVIRCELEPGAYYTEAGLATELGLGKTPTREALARLSLEGWVRSFKSRGYQVRPLSIEGIRQVYGARMVIEPAAVAMAAGRLDKATIKRLRAHSKFRPAVHDLKEHMAFIQENHAFHLALVEGCGNPLLVEIMTGLLERSLRFMYIGLSVRQWDVQAAGQHEEIVDAVAKGDGEAARALTEQHIEAGERAAIDALISIPAIQSAQVGFAANDA